MTNTYTDPSASEKDEVRFLVQDIRAGEWLLSDEEIDYAISIWKPLYGTLHMVASFLADTLAARYAREAQIAADGVSVGLGQVAQQFRDLAASLRQQHLGQLVGGFPDVGGVSAYELPDPSHKPFAFGTGMHDDLEAGQQDYGSRYPYYPAEYYPGA